MAKDNSSFKSDIESLPASVLKMCFFVGIVFAFTLTVDVAHFFGKITLPIWLSIGNIDDSRVILSAIIGAVSTVLALVFSVVLLVLSMAANQFGPRLLRRFILVQNGQVTIGLFSATFLFSLITLVLVRSENGVEFVPQLTNILVVILLIFSFISLIFYTQNVRKAIQTGNLIQNVDTDLKHAIADFIQIRIKRAYEVKDRNTLKEEVMKLRERCQEQGAVILASKAGYLQEIDHQQLIDAAALENAVIQLILRPGQFVLQNTKIAEVIPASKAQSLHKTVEQALCIGANRTLEQDPEFAIAQIVEIGIRALSPAVNDTFTGIACIDWLCNDILSLVKLPDAEAWYDIKGEVRLIEPSLKFNRMVAFAFDMMRQSGANNPAILIRLLQNFKRMGEYLHTDEERVAFLRQVDAIYEVAEQQKFSTADHNDILNSVKQAKLVLSQGE
ncbi:MAG: DUF2254 domain-containing protein [Gammaproteobacteria bacterium]|jgi:uncharacterized membrane protein